MKYVRTKDGIYNAIKEFKIGEMIGVPYNGLVKIVAKADTIEELCDEFVLISELEKRIIKPKELDRDCEGWTKEIGIPEGMIKVYGAIWTDKGLKYVAKMNDKGELELL